MSTPPTIEAFVLNTTVIACLALVLVLRIYPRLRIAILFTAAWQLAVLPWLNAIAQARGWWSFEPSRLHLLGMPLSLYLAWVLWWGVIATIALGKLPVRHAAFIIGLSMVVFDIIAMPLLEPALVLSPSWLLGELLLITAGLLPSLWLAHIILLNQRVKARALMMAFSFGILLLTVLPLVLGRDPDEVIAILNARPPILNLAIAALVFAVALPGVAGMLEFAHAGKGTPIPYDPPRSLVTTGVYAYTANPMQSSAILTLFAWALLLDSKLCAATAAIAIIYAIGIASWSEKTDLKARYGTAWQGYRRSVPAWRYRLFPHIPPDQPPAKLYVDLTCEPCSKIAQWFQKRNLHGLEIQAAADWKGAPLKRITYLYPDGETRSDGVAAIASALNHLHLAWAALGWTMRLPGVLWITQRAMDTTLPSK